MNTTIVLLVVCCFLWVCKNTTLENTEEKRDAFPFWDSRHTHTGLPEGQIKKGGKNPPTKKPRYNLRPPPQKPHLNKNP